jgi:hypothetical protein
MTNIGFVLAFLLPLTASAQGNPRQEKADVLFRDLDFGEWSGLVESLRIPNPLHGGVFYQFSGGDPDNLSNSKLIEMLGPPTSRMGTWDKEGFVSCATFHGAYSDPIPLSFVDRRIIIDKIQDMESRPSAIGYSTFTIPRYLDWTGVGPNLTLDNIVNLRSDAAVEFAYADSGFPIVYLNAGQTIVSHPNVFVAAANAFTFRNYLYPGLLVPRFQRARMVPALAADPIANIHDASGNLIFPGGASSMTSISVDVFDFRSGPGGLELWQGDIVPGGTPYACTYSGSAKSSQKMVSVDEKLKSFTC